MFPSSDSREKVPSGAEDQYMKPGQLTLFDPIKGFGRHTERSVEDMIHCDVLFARFHQMCRYGVHSSRESTH
jgi:hypothetical protein